MKDILQAILARKAVEVATRDAAGIRAAVRGAPHGFETSRILGHDATTL